MSDLQADHRSPITDHRFSAQLAAAGHDYVHGFDRCDPHFLDDAPPLRVQLLGTIGYWFVLAMIAGICLLSAGCSAVPTIPPGTNVQYQATGLDLAPLGTMPQYPSFTLGTKTVIASTSPPADVGAGLNRAQIRAPFGTDITSTVATSPGELGDNVAKAAPAIATLHADRTAFSGPGAPP